MGANNKDYQKRCPVCFTEFIGSRRQTFCSRYCYEKQLRKDVPERMIIQHWKEREDEIENRYNVCATFNCGKRLSLMESLASNYCTNCAHERELINKENIYQ